MTSEISPSDDKGAVRVGDSERQAVLQRLDVAHREGQIDLTEFDERSQAAVGARTRADLAKITRDLPDVLDGGGSASPGRPAVAASGSAQPSRAASRDADVAGARQNFLNAVRGWAFIAVICNGVWIATMLSGDDTPAYWPIWPMLGVGIGVIATGFSYQQAKNR